MWSKIEKIWDFLSGRAGKALHYGHIPTVRDGMFHHFEDDVPKLDPTCRDNPDYLGSRNDTKTIASSLKSKGGAVP
jgi:hypothetical protein